MFVELVKVKVASKSRFRRKHSVDLDAEKQLHEDGFEDSYAHSVIDDTGVSTSTSLQSYKEQSKEHYAATRIQTAFRGFLVCVFASFVLFFFFFLNIFVCVVVICYYPFHFYSMAFSLY